MTDSPDSAEPPRRRSWRIVVPTVLLVVVIVAWLVRTLLPGLPQITQADLVTAQARWQANEVHDYDMMIVLAGRKNEEIKTTVRNGEPVSVVRNGMPLKEQRTMRPWTVPGLLEMLELDFDNAAHPAEKFGSPDVHVVLRGEFDPQYGFPRRYLQQIYGRLDDLSWTVTEFVPK